MFMSPLPERRTLGDTEIELMVCGEGRPLLFLHAGHGVEPGDPLIEQLARSYRVIVPSHPGFGASSRPSDIDSVDGVTYVYLDLIEQLDLRDAILVGVSFGAWIALELVTKGSGRFSKMVLIDAVGLKFGNRESRDVFDIHGTTIEDIPNLFFHDQQAAMTALHQLDFQNMPEAAAMRFARNREALILFSWSPLLHNPKLRGRLHRANLPTLVLWGAQDKIVSVDYGRQLAASLPDGRFEAIELAGHYGYLEKPADFAHAIETFLAE